MVIEGAKRSCGKDRTLKAGRRSKERLKEGENSKRPRTIKIKRALEVKERHITIFNALGDEVFTFWLEYI